MTRYHCKKVYHKATSWKWLCQWPLHVAL